MLLVMFCMGSFSRDVCMSFVPSFFMYVFCSWFPYVFVSLYMSLYLSLVIAVWVGGYLCLCAFRKFCNSLCIPCFTLVMFLFPQLLHQCINYSVIYSGSLFYRSLYMCFVRSSFVPLVLPSCSYLFRPRYLFMYFVLSLFRAVFLPVVISVFLYFVSCFFL